MVTAPTYEYLLFVLLRAWRERERKRKESEATSLFEQAGSALGARHSLPWGLFSLVETESFPDP
jgi:hypothetical protein